MLYFVSLLIAFLTVLPASSTPTPSPFIGTINAPTTMTDISGGTFPFDYSVSNWCEEGYNHFKVFASQGVSPPTVDDLDSNGDLTNALAAWGTFTVANFGLQPLGTQPPSDLTLSLPTDLTTEDKQTYISVVQTFNSCPGHVVQEIGITSVAVAV